MHIRTYAPAEHRLAPEWFKGKRVTVMGLGIHGGGLGAAKWLLRQGARVTVTDLRGKAALETSVAALDQAVAARKAKGEKPSLRYVLGAHPEELFTDADMVIRNPAVPRGNKFIALAEAKGVRVESDIALFFHLCPFPILAVSGTKGKTTTTMLLAAICRTHDKRTVIGGNVRISPLDALDKLIALSARKSVAPPIVLELSSWQLESLERHKLSPHVGVVVNVMPDHLDRYDGMADYARAKELIVAHQKEGDIAVLNADNTWTAAMARRKGEMPEAPHGGRRIVFSVTKEPKGDAAFLRGGQVILREDGKETAVVRLSTVKLLGDHNAANILAAIAAARAYGIPLHAIRKGLKSFAGVPHRLEDIRNIRGVRYVNDTAATAPDASIAALKTFGTGVNKKRIILLSGGADKNLEFGPWAKAVVAYAKRVILFDGTVIPKMTAALKRAKLVGPIVVVKSMPEAVALAEEIAAKGDVVLLSPGCASFGVFKNEFDRGEKFIAAVRKLR